MIHSIHGKVTLKRAGYIVVEVAGIGLKIFVSEGIADNLPAPESEVSLFTYLNVKEDALELFGFLTEKELVLFENLNRISGIGPKSALGILSIAETDRIIAAINEGKTELLTKVSGVGRKTAERVVLELKGKLSIETAPGVITLMESDVELEDTLVSLGYTKKQAQGIIRKIDPSVRGFKERFKAALKESKK